MLLTPFARVSEETQKLVYEPGMSIEDVFPGNLIINSKSSNNICPLTHLDVKYIAHCTSGLVKLLLNF